MSGEIAWEEPGEVDAEEPVWVRRLAPLQEHPNRWAKFGPVPVNVATKLEHAAAGDVLRRNPIAIPPGRWEITIRRRGAPERKRFVYARYLGPEATE